MCFCNIIKHKNKPMMGKHVCPQFATAFCLETLPIRDFLALIPNCFFSRAISFACAVTILSLSAITTFISLNFLSDWSYSFLAFFDNFAISALRNSFSKIRERKASGKLFNFARFLMTYFHCTSINLILNPKFVL